MQAQPISCQRQSQALFPPFPWATGWTHPSQSQRGRDRETVVSSGRSASVCLPPPRTSLKEDYLYACCACVLCLDCKQGFSRSTVTRVSMETWDLKEGEWQTVSANQRRGAIESREWHNRKEKERERHKKSEKDPYRDQDRGQERSQNGLVHVSSRSCFGQFIKVFLSIFSLIALLLHVKLQIIFLKHMKIHTRWKHK